MTALAPAVPTPRPDPSTQSWPQFLTGALLTVWRPTEWDPDTLVFTGDPANKMTAINLCVTPSCQVIVDGSSPTRCQSCRHYLRRARTTQATAVSEENFDRAYVPRYRSTNVRKVNMFELSELDPLARDEVLYGLQRRDDEGYDLRPSTVAGVVRMIGSASSVLDVPPEMVAAAPTVHLGLWRSVSAHVRRLRLAHAGRDGTEGPVWDCALVGLRAAPNRRYLAVAGRLDFTVIRQEWLRTIVLEAVRAQRPTVVDARQTIYAARVASIALTRRPNGNTPEKLAAADMAVVFNAFATAINPETQEPYSASHRNALLGRWRRLMQFARTAGLMDHVPGSFALRDDLRLPRAPKRGQDEHGRAIPEAWIAHLNAHQHLLGVTGFTNGQWSPEDFARLYRTVYQLIRDTGRRPSEITRLPRTALVYPDGHPTLVYDNTKAGRLGRRLPIDSSTAEVITDWLKHLQTLPVAPGCETYMFPAPGARNRATRGHLTAAQFRRRFDDWLTTVPDPSALDPHAASFPRESIEPYGLRHAYAQRHADNGTPVDVLRELMDHVSVDTTMGYYTVSRTRQRAAIKIVAKYGVDRRGQGTPIGDDLVYERGSIAVPFGNCSEPQNVAAGGKACRIRFQCAGCSYYTADPSYLPPLRAHLADLRTDRELALAADVADWVLCNIDDQIAAYTEIVNALNDQIARATPDERAEITRATTTLAKSRQAQAFVPLADLKRRP